MYKRNETKKINIGNITIGGGNDIAIQSMCNTKTKDIDLTVSQIIELENAGCDIIRVSVPDEESANAILNIKRKIHIPLVADIHFDYRLAILSAKNGADKIRINPGNIGSDENIKKVVDFLKPLNIPIRIGVNGGSLKGKDLLDSAAYNINLLRKYDFENIVVSLKASDVDTTVKAYEMFSEKYNYPIHLGITEAGTLNTGTIKSSIGLGILLYEGLGDTIRVSLSSDPVNEVIVAKKILKSLNLKKGIEVISCPTCARTNINIEKIASEIEDILEKDENLNKKNIKVAIMGCNVNGPGEAKNADIGICGGIGEALLIKKGEIIRKIKEEDIIKELIKEISG